MADEISVAVSLSDTNGNFTFPKVGSTKSITQNVQGGGGPGIVSIPTTAGGTVISPVITTLGWAYFKNLDLTNYVDIGPTSGGAIVAFARLKPGEETVIRLTPGITLRALANTAAVNLDVRVLND
jgi:hypothetical protein